MANRKKKLLWIPALVLAAAVILLLLVKRGGSGPLYTTDTVTRGDIDARIVTTGTLAPVNMVDVGSTLSGKIVKLYADFNTPIKKGQILARLDPALYADAVERNEAGVKSAAAQFEQAKLKLGQARKESDRSLDLFTKSLISKEDKEAAEESLAAARELVKTSESDLRQAQDDLRSSRVDLSHTEIVSPLDGIVVTRLVSEGQTLAARMDAPVLFKVADDISRLRIECTIDEADAGRVKAAEEVLFQVDAFPDETLRGRIVEVRLNADTDQGVTSYKAIAEVDNPGARLRPGMTAIVSIHTGAAGNVLRVPNAALQFDPPTARPASSRPSGWEPRKRDHVWVLSPAGRPVSVAVRIGLSDGIISELVSGDLAEGQAVITGLRQSR
jgi:HlyD family secretion protein